MEENDAGWSSQVARMAHNHEAEGSNPSPATKHEPSYEPVEPSGDSSPRSSHGFDDEVEDIEKIDWIALHAARNERLRQEALDTLPLLTHNTNRHERRKAASLQRRKRGPIRKRH